MHSGLTHTTWKATLRYITVKKLRRIPYISIYFELGGLKVAKTICQVVLRSDGD